MNNYCFFKTAAVIELLLFALIASINTSAVASSTARLLNNSSSSSSTPPQLNGQHFRITVVETGSFLKVIEEEEEKGGGGDTSDTNKNVSLSFSGYLIDILVAVAAKHRANFTYDLLTPSGLGKSCEPQLKVTQNNSTTSTIKDLYSATYRSQFECGSNDVNDLSGTNVSTEMYMGAFYITPERQLRNHFTMPFAPPHKATPAMYGTATGIRDIADLAEQQKLGIQPVVRMMGSTAVLDYVQSLFPDLVIHPYYGSMENLDREIDNGNIEIFIAGAPLIAELVLRRFQRGECRTKKGKPVGMIGEPMNSGLSHTAIGVSKAVPREVVDTMSYWLNILMICDPNDEFGACPEGNLDMFYKKHVGGTGSECGYVMFPPQQSSHFRLSKGAIAGIVSGAIGIVMLLFAIWHYYTIKQQAKRYKERFVQQIARNIEIGPSPGLIAPEKLAEEILHIGQGKGMISKADLAKWIHDVKMEFITEKDFDALWSAMDVNRTGLVNPVEFIVFLSACGPEFEKVYAAQEKMSKLERLKLAARRLTNLAELGEEGVRRIENKLDRSSRDIGPIAQRRSGFVREG